MFNNKAALKIGFPDLFKTNIPGGDITRVSNVAATSRNDFANRAFSIGFTYNFGSDNSIKKKRETGSSESEQRRVGPIRICKVSTITYPIPSFCLELFYNTGKETVRLCQKKRAG